MNRTKAYSTIRHINQNPDGTMRYEVPQIGEMVRIIDQHQVSGAIFGDSYAMPELKQWGGQIGTIQGFYANGIGMA